MQGPFARGGGWTAAVLRTAEPLWLSKSLHCSTCPYLPSFLWHLWGAGTATSTSVLHQGENRSLIWVCGNSFWARSRGPVTEHEVQSLFHSLPGLLCPAEFLCSVPDFPCRQKTCSQNRSIPRLISVLSCESYGLVWSCLSTQRYVYIYLSLVGCLHLCLGLLCSHTCTRTNCRWHFEN